MGPGQLGVSKLCPGRGTGVAAWIAGQGLQHHSVWLLRDHNLTPSRGTGGCEGASENVSSRGNQGTFVGSKASGVSLFWLVLGCFHDSRCCNSLSHQFQSKGVKLLLRTAWVVVGRGPKQSARGPFFVAQGRPLPLPHHSTRLNEKLFF